MNQIIIRGHLGANPEVFRGTDPSNPYVICRFSVATNTVWKDAQGNKQERTEWHKVKTTGKTAEACAQYLSKGRNVLVVGELRKKPYMGKAIDANGQPILYGNGQPVMAQMSGVDIVVGRGGTVEFLDKNPNAQNAYVQNGVNPAGHAVPAPAAPAYAAAASTPPAAGAPMTSPAPAPTNPVNAAAAGMIQGVQNTNNDPLGI